MKHGPIALVDENMPVVFILPQHDIYDKVISNMQEVKARKGRIIAIASEKNDILRKRTKTPSEAPVTAKTMPAINARCTNEY